LLIIVLLFSLIGWL